MQHDPTEPDPVIDLGILDDHGAAVEDLAAVRVLPDHDRQHMDLEHGFAAWDDTMLRHHEQFIRPDGSIDLDGIHARDHRLSWDRNHEHAPDRHAGRDQAEQAFDRLNPEFGIAADLRDPAGHQAVQDREAGLALGTRAATALEADHGATRAAWLTSAAAWGAVPEAEHDWGWQR